MLQCSPSADACRRTHCAWYTPIDNLMYTIHDREPIPFALVQPHQQVKPFGRPATAKAARKEPLNLKIDDIAGTRTRLHCFATSPRLTNPVDPHYQLPRCQLPDAPAPRFIRNTLDISDIPGSQVSAPSAACSPYLTPIVQLVMQS